MTPTRFRPYLRKRILLPESDLPTYLKNARDYGFLPTASAAVNAAAMNVALRGGGWIIVTVPGVYEISDTLLFPSNTRLTLAEGVTIAAESTMAKLMARNDDWTSGNANIMIEGGYWRGNNMAMTGQAPTLWNGSITNWVNITNLHFRDVRFFKGLSEANTPVEGGPSDERGDFAQWAIAGWQMQHVLIENCRSQAWGALFQCDGPASNITLRDCYGISKDNLTAMWGCEYAEMWENYVGGSITDILYDGLVAESCGSLVVGGGRNYLFNSKLCTGIGTGSPCEVTWPEHGLSTGDTIQLYLTNTTPTIDGLYTVTVLNADTLEITPSATVTQASSGACYILSPQHPDYDRYVMDRVTVKGCRGLLRASTQAPGHAIGIKYTDDSGAQSSEATLPLIGMPIRNLVIEDVALDAGEDGNTGIHLSASGIQNVTIRNFRFNTAGYSNTRGIVLAASIGNVKFTNLRSVTIDGFEMLNATGTSHGFELTSGCGVIPLLRTSNCHFHQAEGGSGSMFALVESVTRWIGSNLTFESDTAMNGDAASSFIRCRTDEDSFVGSAHFSNVYLRGGNYQFLFVDDTMTTAVPRSKITIDGLTVDDNYAFAYGNVDLRLSNVVRTDAGPWAFSTGATVNIAPNWLTVRLPYTYFPAGSTTRAYTIPTELPPGSIIHDVVIHKTAAFAGGGGSATMDIGTTGTATLFTGVGTPDNLFSVSPARVKYTPSAANGLCSGTDPTDLQVRVNAGSVAAFTAGELTVSFYWSATMGND